MRLNLVVAQGPEQAHGDGHGTCRRARMSGRVELHEPPHAATVSRREPGGRAFSLGAHNGPLASRRSRRLVGTARDLVGAHRSRVDAVGEPARVRHFVDGVDVARRHVGGRIARLGEQVQQQIGRQLDVHELGARGVLRLGFLREGIVGEESRQVRAARGHQPGARQQQRRHDRTCRQPARVIRTPRSTRRWCSIPRCRAPARHAINGEARAVKAQADAGVVFEVGEIEVGASRRDFARVVEQRHVHAQAVGNPPPLDRGKQAVPIAKAPAAIRAQRAAAAKRRASGNTARRRRRRPWSARVRAARRPRFPEAQGCAARRRRRRR